MKTLQECKDEVAKKHHWDNWKSMQYTGIDEGIFEQYQNEAAELYAESKLTHYTKTLSKVMQDTLIFKENDFIGAGKQRAIGYNEAIKFISEYLIKP